MERIEILEEHVARINERLNELKGEDNSLLKNENEMLKQEVQYLKDYIEELEVDWSGAVESVGDTLTKKIEALKAESAKSHAELQQTLSQKRQEIKFLLHTQQEMIKGNKQISTMYLEAKEQLAEKQELTTDFQESLEFVTGENEKLLIRVDELEADNRITEGERRTSAEEMERLRNEVSKAKYMQMNTSLECQDLRKENAEYEAFLEEQEREVKELEKACENLLARLDKLSKESQNKTDSIYELRKTIVELEGRSRRNLLNNSNGEF